MASETYAADPAAEETYAQIYREMYLPLHGTLAGINHKLARPRGLDR